MISRMGCVGATSVPCSNLHFSTVNLGRSPGPPRVNGHNARQTDERLLEVTGRTRMVGSARRVMWRMLKRIGGRWQILLGAAIASTPLLAVLIGQSSTRSGRVALYAGVGEELSAYLVDIEQATLTKQSSVTLPSSSGSVGVAIDALPLRRLEQRRRELCGTGVPAAGDKHGVTAFRIDAATGALQTHGARRR